MFGEVPGRVDRRAAEAVGRRWSRANALLSVTWAWCAAELVVSLVALAWTVLSGPELPLVGSPKRGDLVGLAFVALIVLLPMPLASWAGRRDADGIDWRLKPDGWLMYGFIVGIAQALGLFLSITYTALPLWVRIGVGIIGAAVPVVAALLARRAILAEPLREIGGSEFVLVKGLRSPQGGGEDSVKITGDSMRLSVRTAAGRPAGQAAAKDIRLADITEIGVRPARPDDGAWAPLADGRGASLPEGDVVVIRTRTDTQLLPADTELAELLRARAALHGAEPARIEDWT
ncbi:hypothetical protein QFW96_23085 [Saccharopolyspora sp. TS4A08]|uniref:Uncharacterized protein n=1 Tax=Saccharopolyspora ipomoeae TaxID=3042027 RepID=A0ABT6PU49_9PSEU|nr:hypothetical protein [Saccharopolyspora sp. TS4A08]MDI2031532.1 hypothetical protein [Saccharopolyspora sp. TS4A08]